MAKKKEAKLIEDNGGMSDIMVRYDADGTIVLGHPALGYQTVIAKESRDRIIKALGGIPAPEKGKKK